MPERLAKPALKHLTPLLLALTCLTANAGWQDAKVWASIEQPNSQPDAPQSLGRFTAGCISHAHKLPINGIGYQAMRLSRQRLYGHPDLINFIQRLGETAQQRGWGSVLVGDLGQARGGPTPSGHRSHQSGLDVDIWFQLSDVAATRLLTQAEREHWSAPNMLAAKGRLDTQRWQNKHDQLLQAAAEDARVARIFVNPAIKQHLCASYGSASWLRKIRPWYQHHDHFHVRLRCPKDSLDCIDQAPPPSGDSCDASLAWWFTPEAYAPAKPITKPKPKPQLPQQCQRVLTAP
ncbi:MAG: penicillin-insensitive murein endopeptidase [Methylococcales bacterium]|nr:penicillin-insensitive murein endopeptidase [Methylococcales bacterium]